MTSRMKERLTQQLLDGDLRSYLVEKEHWNAQHFEDWTNFSTVFKRLPKGRHTAVAKATHQQYYGAPGLDINNTMDTLNHAACASVRQKTGATS
jgi:hypothetical protein